MRLLHKIVKVLDRLTLKPSESASHRLGREVHVGELSLHNPAIFYSSAGMTITSLVNGWTETIEGKLEIVTENTIYFLEISRQTLK
jgi:hypothetical protein